MRIKLPFCKHFEVMGTSKYLGELRKKEKSAFRMAAAQYADSDKIYWGSTMISKSDFKNSRIVLLGDDHILTYNTLTGNPIKKEEIRQAVARGWCTNGNTDKDMDADLAEAITDEVLAAIDATEGALIEIK